MVVSGDLAGSSLMSSKEGGSIRGKTVGAVAGALGLTASALGLWVQQTRAERTKGTSEPIEEERES